MITHRCWICKTLTGHEQVVNPRYLGREGQHPYGYKLAFAAYECSVCQGVSIAWDAVPGNYGYSAADFFGNKRGDELQWRPTAGDSKDYPEVPEHIAQAATEAYECDSLEHYRAAILLARSVIEATAKDKDITSGNLQSKIDALEEAKHIRPLIKDAAHGVRLFGNDMAHGDFVQPITKEESAQVIYIMGEILDEVYQQPAKVQRVTEAVQTRRAGGNA